MGPFVTVTCIRMHSQGAGEQESQQQWQYRQVGAANEQKAHNTAVARVTNLSGGELSWLFYRR